MQDFLDTLTPALISVDSGSAEHLEQCARVLAPLLRGGDFVGLIGDLGAGKTTWCRALGEGLNAKQPLRSPSYLLMHEIDADIPILHLDAYFEHRIDSLLAEGDCERFSDDNLVLVEWANNASQWWPDNGLYVHLTHNSGGGRTLAVHSSGERGAELARAYCELLKSGINIEPTTD